MAVGQTSYPGSLDTTTNLPIASALSGVQMDGDGNDNKKHSNLHGVVSEAVVQLETKVGTGSSTASEHAVLTGTGSGTSAWDITPGITGVGALNAGSITSGFGAIDVGSDGITTTGAIAGGTIDATDDFTIGTTVITDDAIGMAAGVITFTPSTSDTVTLTAAANGAFAITTVDNAAHAGNLTVTIDGAITLDAVDNIELDSATGIWIFEDGGTEVLRFTESGSGDVTIKLAVNGKDLIFTDNGDAAGLTIKDAAGGIVVPGGVEVGDSKFIDFASAAGTPTSNDGAQGVVIEFLAVEAITQWDCVYASTTTGRVGRADANDLAKMPAIGVAIEGQGSAGSSVRVLTHGVFRDDGGFSGAMTPGVDLYVPEVPGTPTTTIPDADGDFVQVLGVAVGTRSAFINPSMDVIERD